MFALSPLNEELFDELQVRIGYCKMFPHIVEDFVTRKDAAVMMVPSNLPVNTTVNTGVVGTLTPPTTVAGTGVGKGSGATTPAYKGDTLLPADELLKQEKQAIVNAGGIGGKVVEVG